MCTLHSPWKSTEWGAAGPSKNQALVALTEIPITCWATEPAGSYTPALDWYWLSHKPVRYFSALESWETLTLWKYLGEKRKRRKAYPERRLMGIRLHRADIHKEGFSGSVGGGRVCQQMAVPSNLCTVWTELMIFFFPVGDWMQTALY